MPIKKVKASNVKPKTKKKLGRPKLPKGKKRKSKYRLVQPVENEEWRYIDETDDCYVSNEGRVKWIEHYEIASGEKRTKEWLLPLRADTKGYLRVTLKYPEDSKVSNNKRRHRVHVLVATAFVPNPEGLPVVNHINGVKSWNFVNVNPEIDERKTNIEWSTYSYNLSHSYRTGLRQTPKKDTSEKKHRHTCIIAMQRNTRECYMFRSQGEASERLRIEKAQINHNLHNDGLTCHGYMFGYLDEINMTD